MKLSNHAGFTLVELMISTVIFGIMLLILTGGIIYEGRVYQKGISTSRAQNTTRLVAQQVAQPIQFSGVKPMIGTPVVFIRGVGTYTAHSLCLGDIRYTYVLDRRLQAALPVGHDANAHAIKHVIWRDHYTGPNAAACPPGELDKNDPSVGLGTNGEELMPSAMRLVDFDVQPSPAGPSLWTIKINIIYGFDADIERDGFGNITGCQPSTLGNIFCGQAQLTTSAYRRLSH